MCPAATLECMEPSTPGGAEVEEARERFERLRSRLNAARIAFARGVPFDDEEVTYERLAGIARETIRANYDLQRLRYGKVRLRLSVAKLLRRGW